MNKRSTKSISFLMEFIIVLFFFSVSAAICVNVYANAEQINRESNDIKKALIIVQNYVEAIDDTFMSEVKYNQDGSLSEFTHNESYFVLNIKKDEKEYVFNAIITHEGNELVSIPFIFKGGEDDA